MSPSSTGDLTVSWLWNLLNTIVELFGYYLAAMMVDHKFYGRKRMQTIGFLADGILYLVAASESCHACGFGLMGQSRTTPSGNRMRSMGSRRSSTCLHSSSSSARSELALPLEAVQRADSAAAPPSSSLRESRPVLSCVRSVDQRSPAARSTRSPSERRPTDSRLRAGSSARSSPP